MSTTAGDALLSVRDLVTEFPIRAGVFRREVGRVQAVSGVSFDLMANETLGVVGESGCGKTTLGRSLLRLVPPTSGQVMLGDRDITTAGRQDLRELRREIQMVFQDPYASLNPRIPVRDIIGEPMRIHGVPKEEAADRVSDLLLCPSDEAVANLAAILRTCCSTASGSPKASRNASRRAAGESSANGRLAASFRR